MIRKYSAIIVVLCLLGLAVSGAPPALLAQNQATGPLTIRITSPLGRTGVAGTVRIVAQVTSSGRGALPSVRFLVDGKLLQTVTAPPYAIDWADEDPLLEREIVVEAFDAAGNKASDSITLKPFTVTDESEVISVVVEASVFDKKGRFVPGLGPSDFTLRDDGQQQEISFASQQAIPVTFALLIDSSQSMSYNMEFVRAAARRLSTHLRPKDTVIVAPFSTGLFPITGPTDDQKTMLEAIRKMPNAGGTAILDSLGMLAQRMNNLEGRRAIVLVTDGYDENSTWTMDDTLKALHKAQATVFVVGIGGIAGISMKGQADLKHLASETGGRAYFPWRLEDLSEVYNTLAVDVQTRYLLAYTPASQIDDGRWHPIEITTRGGDSVTQTRKGYFARLPPPVRPTIEFTLSDGEHKYFDVSMSDLVVFEDGVEQKIDSFQEAVSPVSVVLALDSSGSIRSAAPLVIEAARGFVGALRPKDALGVLMFADRSTLMQDLSTVRQQSFEAIDQYKVGGGTALYDALADSFSRLKNVPGRRAVVIVTDGRDENNPGTGPGSTRKFEDVLALQKESGAVVYGIGVGSNVDRESLETLARVSGGQAYFPVDATGLPEQYARIVENLRRRFALSYTSSNGTRDGAWRKVEIRVRTAKLLVASAGGYFAPSR
jgi:Ca-activated chloride channel family protein